MQARLGEISNAGLSIGVSSAIQTRWNWRRVLLSISRRNLLEDYERSHSCSTGSHMQTNSEVAVTVTQREMRPLVTILFRGCAA